MSDEQQRRFEQALSEGRDKGKVARKQEEERRMQDEKVRQAIRDILQNQVSPLMRKIPGADQPYLDLGRLTCSATTVLPSRSGPLGPRALTLTASVQPFAGHSELCVALDTRLCAAPAGKELARQQSVPRYLPPQKIEKWLEDEIAKSLKWAGAYVSQS